MSLNRDIWVFDQRGHGDTYLSETYSKNLKITEAGSHFTEPSSRWTIDLLAEDLKSFAEAVKIEKFNLLGHSMGGRVALRFARKFPERIQRLMILDTSPELSPAVANFIESILEKTPVPFKSRVDAKNYLAEAFDDKAFSQFLYTNLREIKPGEVHWTFDAEGMKALLQDMAEKPVLDDMLQSPEEVLLLRGENSTHFLLKHEKLLKKHPKLPKSLKIQTIEGAGHMMHSAKPREVSSALEDFLEASETL
jgi:esterase